MRRLEFAEIARADLRSIRRYSQRAWGVERTAQYMTALRHTMKGLVAGTVVSRERDDLRLGLHMAISGRHCIFFEADLWRETFLSKGDARLFVLDLKGLSVKSAGNARPLAATELLQSNNRRLVLEQLLVMEAVSRVDDSIWIVNARQ